MRVSSQHPSLKIVVNRFFVGISVILPGLRILDNADADQSACRYMMLLYSLYERLTSAVRRGKQLHQ